MAEQPQSSSAQTTQLPINRFIFYLEKNKTSAVCEAVCGYHKRKDLKDTLREVLREELKHVSVPQDVKDNERQDLAMDAGVLDFLQTLQNE